ncbi:MAG TPA: FAD-dependent oxidoreductase [Candidatus Paceibacterota bacterium]|nr:FAD-dependent oxidoreductase [Candidatus Paceibacterota bacterium]
MIDFIDRLLNRITMYRLVLYVLIAFVALGAIFGAVHWVPVDPTALVFSTLFLIVLSWLANALFAKIFDAHPNHESTYITALILALIVPPASPNSLAGVTFLAAAAVVGMASKYLLAIGKKHVFNPAALAVVVTAFALGDYASWWVGGNLPMLPFVLVGGLLVVRKIQRFDLVLPFLGAAAISCIALSPLFDPAGTLERLALHTPLFFFAFIMLTEPLTTPPTRSLRIAYAVLVGALYSPYIHIGPVYSIPELALLVGNVFAYLVSPKRKYRFVLREKKAVSADIYDFSFEPVKGLSFRPGQYLEWTLAHELIDSRGNRRYFTIASSPTEPNVRLGVRFYDNSSSFKKRMLAMKPGDPIFAGQLAGDFTLPDDLSKKLVFVAGGIGITPFRSMVKHISDSGGRRDAVLLYSNRTNADISYKEIFDEAETGWGLRTVYVVTGEGEPAPAHNGVKGRIDADLIRRTVPDYRERIFYISGTEAMVSGFKKTLRELGIPLAQIETDFFPGFL